MDLVNDFLHRHFVYNHTCDYCGRHFPASCIINYDSPFQEIAGKYCTVCFHKVLDLVDYCDCCGEEYPKGHIYKSLISKEQYCKNCIKGEFGEHEEESDT